MLHRIRPVGPPALGERLGSRRLRRPRRAARARDGHRGRSTGTHPGRAARASLCTRPSTARFPAAPTACAAHPRDRRPRRSPAHRARAPSRARADRGDGRRGIASSAGSTPDQRLGRRERRGSPPRADARAARRSRRRACRRACAAPRSETCWPSTARTASSWPSTAPATRLPGALATREPSSGSSPSASSDAARIGIEVEQCARALHRAARSRRSASRKRALHVPVGGSAARRRRRRAAGAGCGGSAPSCTCSTPGNGAQPEERDQALRVQRRAVGQAQRQRAAVLWTPMSARSHAQRARRHREHLPDRRVELTHALKARREGHVGDRQRGRLEQDASGLRALGASEGERTRAHDGHELAVHVTLGVAEAAGETAHALAIHHAVGDQTHRAPDQVRAQIPLRRSRRRVRTAALARPKAGGLSRRRGRKKSTFSRLGVRAGQLGRQ